MKKKLIIFSILLLCISLPLKAQWAIAYGGSNDDWASSILQTSDGGFIVGGFNDSELTIVKLDPEGLIEWQKLYGSNYHGGNLSFQQTSDGGYIIASTTISEETFPPYLHCFGVLKINANGDIEWQHSYFDGIMDYVFTISQTQDGGYIVAGATYNQFAYWVLKLNQAGEIQWQRAYGGEDSRFPKHARSILQTEDGGYIVAGNAIFSPNSDRDIWVLKLDMEGDIEWQLAYGGASDEGLGCIQPTPDGGFIIAGDTASFGAGGGDALVLKLDKEGLIEWQKTYGLEKNDGASFICRTSDGGYIVAGTTDSAGFGSSDVSILKLFSNGEIDWQSSYGGWNGEEAHSVQEIAHGGYIVAGSTWSFGAGHRDMLILKLSPRGLIDPICELRHETDFLAIPSNLVPRATIESSSTRFRPPIKSHFSIQEGHASIMMLCHNSPSVIYLSTQNLYFGADTAGNKTPSQEFRVINSGAVDLEWSADSSDSWISCSPANGKGSRNVVVSIEPEKLASGYYVGRVSIFAADAYLKTQYVYVTLNKYGSNQDRAPIGKFETPGNGTVVSGSVPVTGWAVDDIWVDKVQILRDSIPEDPEEAIGPDGTVFIGNAVFVEGARPDVEQTLYYFPGSNRAGWGYMLLTYCLPNGGNGAFRLYAYAEDVSGNRTLLGTKQITSDNNNRVKPFGAIDTPDQGGIAAGTEYVNFGWALTPLPKKIPEDGSTIWVWIDGVPLGHPTYNNYREDIATMFPGYLNSNGAVGYYYIDTTQYENGLHSIQWSVTDDQGDVDGIGSRYFEIENIGSNASSMQNQKVVSFAEDQTGRLRISARLKERGFGGRAALADRRIDSRAPREFGDRGRPLVIEIEELERIVLELKAEGGTRYIGWGSDETKRLPIGSTLDSENGVFYWIPGPGFLGKYKLHFAVTDGVHRSNPVNVIVNINPRHYMKK